MLGGIVQEGNGFDDDGDGLVDDTGDFNGDWMISYDPEWHLNEDPPGDANQDGYPGIGAPVDSPDSTDQGDLVEERQGTRLRSRNDSDRLTSFTDDDADGFADFRDPQVIAAMYRPDADLVDNDNDGEVDEPGECYVAAWDNDEDGRMDEDPPEFQFILNLADYVDQWVPMPITGDRDVQEVLRRTSRDLVLADPPTVRIFDHGITSSRQRAFEMHPKFVSGPNRQQQAFLENEMELLLPNPPDRTNPVAYRGVEGIRFNEALVKPMIRLQAEEILRAGPGGAPLLKPGQPAMPSEGGSDDGGYALIGNQAVFDTHWAPDSMIVRPRGFRGTVLPVPPLGNRGAQGIYDGLAPSVVFAVTNTAGSLVGLPEVGTDAEIATWRFRNIPPGEYQIVLYLDKMDTLRSEVAYGINGARVPMRSDFHFQMDADGDGLYEILPILPLAYGGTPGYALDRFAGYMPKLPPEYVRTLTTQVGPQVAAVMAGLGSPISPGAWLATLLANPQFRLAQAYNYQFLVPGFVPGRAHQAGQPAQPGLRATSMLRLPYRLYPRETGYQVTVGQNGLLDITIEALTPQAGYYVTTFDYIELINLSAQYLELVNITPDDIDLTGWTVNTPYGKYVIQQADGQRPIIPRIKPLFEEDDGREDALEDGVPLPGRPWDRAVYPRARDGLGGRDRTAEDLRLDNNFMLLVHDYEGFMEWVDSNYPELPPDVAVLELPRADDPMLDPAYNSDPLMPEKSTFKLVDRESDILTDNYDTKIITLTDPAGNEFDRFEYKTTFNNLVVDVPGNPVQLPTALGQLPLWEANTLDVVALPGYRGMEVFERGDPTQIVTEDRPDRDVMTKRFTPTRRLLARDAAIEVFAVAPGQEESRPLTVMLYGGRRLSSDPGMVISENPETALDDRRYVGGWDFVGDAPDPGHAGDDPEGNGWGGVPRSSEFGASDLFKRTAGGFENYTNALDPLDFLPTSRPYPGDLVRFTWTLGLRELIRAGFDPDVDDQITVRVRGRQQDSGVKLPAIVGEVLTHPMMTVVNPGEEREEGNYRSPKVAPNPLNPLGFDVFTKLRDGDTAFTIDLRERFMDLYQDLEESGADEPLIVIRLIMRKTTSDYQAIFDNYYFYAIELCGRGRMRGRSAGDDERMALIAGTPGRQNPGWVPAYPRRRRMIDAPTQRDEFDIIDNTPFVKNGLLATPGEISRIMTGGRFETVNGPIISQRLEEAAIYQRDYDSKAELGKRMIPTDEGNTERLIMAQRERLDQYENQYTPLYGMVTTSDSAFSQGQININTAIREVLAALPVTPPQRDDPTKMRDLDDRFIFNSIVADFIIEGRNPLGRDQQFGVAEIDDDLSEQETIDNPVEFKLPSVGRDVRSLKAFSKTPRRQGFPAIVDILSDEQIGARDVRDQRPDEDELYAATIVSLPDDGPYEDISRLLAEIVHMRRRERMATAVRRDLDRTADDVRDGAGDLRERLNKKLGLTGADALTPRDMEEMMNRISGLVTVRSRVFSVLTGGKALTADGGVAAIRRYKSVSRR